MDEYTTDKSRGLVATSNIGVRDAVPLLKFFLAIVALQGFIEFFFYYDGPSWLGIYYRLIRYAFLLFFGTTLLHVFRERWKPIRSGRISVSRVFVIMLVFFILIGGLLGRSNGNIYWRSDTISLLEFLLVIATTYFATSDPGRIRQALASFVRLTGVLALFQCFAYLVQLLRLGDVRWTIGFFTLVLLLGYALSFARLLIVVQPGWQDYATVFLFAAGSLITFHKPVVLSWCVCTGVILVGAFGKSGLRRSLCRFITLALVLTICLFVINAFSRGALLQRYETAFYQDYLRVDPFSGVVVGDISGGRFYLWQVAWALFLDNPLMGRGFGIGLEAPSGSIVVVHNLYLYLLVSIGCLGGLIVVLNLFSLLTRSMRAFTSKIELDLSLGLLGYVGAILAYNYVGLMFFFSPVTYLFGVAIGLLARVSEVQLASKDARGAIVT